MITPDNCFAQQCAGTSLNQIGPAAETASPSSRRTTQGPVVTSFGPLPKLPLQDCADTATATLQSDWAGSAETHLPKLEFPFPVSVLMRVPSFGGETTPYGGGGERRRRVLPRPPPGVSRARPAHAPTFRSDDGGPVPPSTRPPSSSTRAANQKRRPPMADLTLATHRREAIPDLPPAVRANRARRRDAPFCFPIRRRRPRTAKHQTAVVFHHYRPPAKETHHGSADSDPEMRRRKV